MSESTKNPQPPKDLRPETRRWWASVVENYVLEPHHVHLLTLAARALDRAESARVALHKNGMTYVDKHGVRRPSPEAVIAKDSAVTFSRLLRELRLDDAPEDDRLPRISGNRAAPRRQR